MMHVCTRLVFQRKEKPQRMTSYKLAQKWHFAANLEENPLAETVKIRYCSAVSVMLVGIAMLYRALMLMFVILPLPPPRTSERGDGWAVALP